MELLQHIRKDFTNLDPGGFAQQVQKMHGYAQHEINAETIVDLENQNSQVKYPRPLLEEVALYCTRVASVGHSRLITLEDMGFAHRALSADESVGWHAPIVAQDVTQEPEDTSPALAAVTVSG